MSSREDQYTYDPNDYYDWKAWHEGFQCPNGHGQMEFGEGVIGQDLQGNEQYGSWHVCLTCGEEVDHGPED